MTTPDNPVTDGLAAYIVDADELALTPEVLDRGKHSLLDGLMAMLSGSALRPGRAARAYAESRGGKGEATLAGSTTRTNPELAALANGMCAHADETDDVNDLARVHAGASIVPASIAMAETYERTGAELLRAVIVGYDVGCSVNIGAWDSLPAMQRTVRSPHGLGQAFGAAGAAGYLAGLDRQEARQMLSYTAQSISGITSFYRDQHHIGKSYASAGMQAHTGVRATEMVKAGCTDIEDVFDVKPNVYDAFGENGDGNRLLTELGRVHHVTTTDIKQYPIGMPIQAPAEAVERLCQEHGISGDDVERVLVKLGRHGYRIVNNRTMPDISLQYVLAVMLVDGAITFESAHDYDRHKQPDMRAVMAKIELEPDESLDPPVDADMATRRTRIAHVTIETKDGRSLEKFVDAPRGSRTNPFDWDGMARKAHMVLDGFAGSTRVDELFEAVRHIDELDSVRDLRPHLRGFDIA